MSIYTHYFSNFDRPLIPDDICKDSATRHPRFWRKRFLNVFSRTNAVSLVTLQVSFFVVLAETLYSMLAMATNV